MGDPLFWSTCSVAHCRGTRQILAYSPHTCCSLGLPQLENVKKLCGCRWICGAIGGLKDPLLSRALEKTAAPPSGRKWNPFGLKSDVRAGSWYVNTSAKFGCPIIVGKRGPQGGGSGRPLFWSTCSVAHCRGRRQILAYSPHTCCSLGLPQLENV